MTTTSHGQVPAIQRYKIGYHSDEWGVRSSTPGGVSDPSGQWVLYKDHIAALRTAHVQNPAEIEHVAGNVSKNGAELNMSTKAMITGDTKISIKELTDWNLHWMCVDVEYGTGKKQLTVDELADFCERIEGRRIILMQQWNTIYDHPTGLREELQKLPNWRKLDDLLMEVRHKAYDRALNTQRDALRIKLGIKGEK